MCLIVFANKQHPAFDLIFAANRDEFYKRPTRPAQFWDEYPDLLAGKDLSAGGTWMGINRRGQFAALTNYRDPSITKNNAPSRGEIVMDYLKHKKSAISFLEALNKRADTYNGFNVLAGSPRALFHYSNKQHKINRVESGVHGLSNHLLDTPWPKVERAKSALENLISNDEITTDALFKMLTDDRPAPDEMLPATGISLALEKRVSPIFIKTEDYGTRSSTVLLIDKEGRVTFEERRYKKNTQKVDKTSRFAFKIKHK